MKKIIVGLTALFFTCLGLQGAAQPEKKWHILISKQLEKITLFQDSHDQSLPAILRDSKLFDGSIKMNSGTFEIKVKEGVILAIPYHIVAYFLEPRFACINGLAPAYCNCYIYTSNIVFEQYSKAIALTANTFHEQALYDLSIMRFGDGDNEVSDLDYFPYEPIPSPRE
ncbi:hypothetical protein K2X40_05380 [Candidatus Babeliales bacterium]|nr:hypothetical protein [Candidatus Babeliales bacterium]